MKLWVGTASVTVAMSLTGCGGSQAIDTSGYNTNGSSPNSVSTSTVSSAASLGAVTLGAKLIPVMGKPAFVVGMNVDSGPGSDWQLGKNPLVADAKASYDSKTVGASLQDMAGFGSNVVRVRLFNNLQGLKLDSDGFVTGIDEGFEKNLNDLLNKAENDKVQLYICLAGWSGTGPTKNPITDTAARTAYLKKAVAPVIGRLKGRGSVFAIDVFDEIESQIAGKEGNSTDKGATWDQARDFIKATVNTIKSMDPQRLVSCGSGLHGWKNIKSGKFSKLELDFYDFHTYDDKVSLPTAKELKVDRPVLIGACGQSSSKVDPDLQAKVDIAFLSTSLKQGFAGALVGDYSKDADSALSLLDKDGKHRPVVMQIQTFVANLAMVSGTSPTTTVSGGSFTTPTTSGQ